MRKKNMKLLTRITAGILTVVMAATLILQLVSSVSAEELQSIVPATVTASNNDATLGNLPVGFEYVKKGERVEVQKSEDNKLPSIMLSTLPTFDTGVVTVFVGNLDTKEVTKIDLYHAESYAEALDIPYGYYVIYGNDIAWTDANNQSYEVMNGEGLYFYYGEKDSFDVNKYPNIDWELNMDEIIYLSLQTSISATETVAYNGQLNITDTMKSIPADLIPVAQTIDAQQQESVPTTNQMQQQVDNEEDDNFSVSDFISRFFKNSSLFIFLLIGLGIAYYILRKKNQKNIKQQLENDSYDDSRLD